MLFIDCEGLNGGEARPKGLWHVAAESVPRGFLPPDPFEGSFLNDPIRLLRSRYSSHRSIAWAKTPQTKKREYTVAQLYPRLLYTFSDVVVFVLRNPRYFFMKPSVLRTLLTVLEGHSNQPYWVNC